jgi:hypothetical protein
MCGVSGFFSSKTQITTQRYTFLKNNSLEHFTKVIGIASWGFDLIGDNSYFEEFKERIYLRFSPEQIEMHRKDLALVQEAYRKLVRNNPNILFILRYHPASFDFKFNEFYGLESEPNVFISSNRKNGNYLVSDLISSSDLWLAYQSTTTIEAWLMKKPTLLFNPTREDFVREEGYRGSAIYKNIDDLQQAVDEFYRTDRIESFESRAPFRTQAIKDSIGWDDGQNHVRAADMIYKVFKEPKATRSFTTPPKPDRIQKIKYFIANTPASFLVPRLRRMRDKNLTSLIEMYANLVTKNRTHTSKPPHETIPG